MINRVSAKWTFPAEALSALVAIGLVTAATSFGIKAMQTYENDDKPHRWGVDKWDRRMMERDGRLTGNVNVQMAEAKAPLQFSRNSAWELEPRLF
ncbi:hypothetical protein BATDEDRAFT_88253 [Batrachochytrium dendrobatidis JAM81]|uniref:NADH dehydrogenase [ubiquinone] 1 alpha subcomplex subunit 1 n=1 Tax=Batrachochytrium dendrobatidis (strain JAM81 / FGSC 10211) TaxID=684364 RepID=F4P1F2_BATDJ|nr:uncharacterized protein BATDEDRAFT_88253 [Batrachochytrium dendrobatidis JAM81]EGF80897.1 hypothetical protein BATDEDRAFT_88253 [Batrachochytrium dendrobatidis JAM81]KAJ8328711.1 hypothetical protein O5D80_002695 [Batrachochytrium dendrobatidis]KAK5668667.1 hypothetical protein QVD99_004460 [Batrachochytrium dendrobatidis]|eukprot:XP_006678738.1 hypothetical protein BATDEDRAFT_88253 [Batrachochytrium dendrobatidis JAM81]